MKRGFPYAVESGELSLRDMGGALTEVHPKRLRLIGGILCGLLFGLTGSSLLVGGIEVGGPLVDWLLGAVLLLTGGGLLWAVQRAASLRFFLSPTGVLLVARAKGDVCRWYQVEEAQELWVKQLVLARQAPRRRAPSREWRAALAGLLSTFASRRPGRAH